MMVCRFMWRQSRTEIVSVPSHTSTLHDTSPSACRSALLNNEFDEEDISYLQFFGGLGHTLGDRLLQLLFPFGRDERRRVLQREQLENPGADLGVDHGVLFHLGRLLLIPGEEL